MQELGGGDAITSLEKSINLLKFGFVKNGLLFADFNFSKKDMVLSKYTRMSARTSDSPDFCRTKFKGCTPTNVSYNIKLVARNFNSVISTNMPRASASFLLLVHVARADTICLKPSQRFLQARSCVVHLVTDGQISVTCFLPYISAAFLTKLVAKGQ